MTEEVIREPDNVSVINSVQLLEPVTVDAVDLDIRNLVFATDKVDVSGSSVSIGSVSGTVTANQGTPNTTVNRWPIQITDGTDLALVTAAGEVNVFSTAQPGVDIGDITVNNAAGASAVNIQDGGNSLTVDAVDLDIRNLVFATDKVDVSGSSVALDGPTLAALESITVQNPAGASAVNIQDGGNSITVDGTVTAAPKLADLGVTATAAVGVAVTLTLPAAGVGLFHAISRLEITADTAPVVLGANASAVVTSTNLPGGPAWNVKIERAGGGINTVNNSRVNPFKSLVANTATTIVAPATANTIWRLNVEYFTSA